MPQTEIIVTVM